MADHWSLAPGVFAAWVEGDLVFLDSRNNQYQCIGRGAAGGLAALFEAGDDQGDRPGLRIDASLIADLKAAGLIARNSQVVPLPMMSPSARGDFHDAGAPDLPVTLQTIWHLLLSAAEVSVELLFSSPAHWLRPKASSPSKPSLARAASLALQFDRLRPFIPWSGRCLPNSMLLLAFLRRSGIDADWVFGVQTFPFEAHCWVEQDGLVLNDTLEHVRWYTPIAAR